MKRLTYIGIIMIVGILACAANLLAGPDDYLAAESSSYGLAISKEIKQAALAKEKRLLLYQAEIDELDSDDLELQAAEVNTSEDNLEENINVIYDATPSGANDTGDYTPPDEM